VHVRTAPAPWSVAVDAVTGDAVVATRFVAGASRVAADGSTRWSAPALGHSPSAVAIVPRGGYALVATHLGSRLEVLDLSTGQRVESINVEFLTIDVALLDDVAYVASRIVELVDTTTWQVVADHPLPSGATSCAATSEAVWVGCADSIVRVTRAGTTVIARERGPHTVGADAQTPMVWVADHRRGTCSLLDGAGSARGTVAIDGHPWHISASGGLAFVACPQENRIAVLDAATVTQVDELEVSRPWSVAYDATRDALWVASPLDGVIRWLSR
jgi:DNA-binding beta-propeller fold protein YncE